MSMTLSELDIILNRSNKYSLNINNVYFNEDYILTSIYMKSLDIDIGIMNYPPPEYNLNAIYITFPGIGDPNTGVTYSDPRYKINSIYNWEYDIKEFNSIYKQYENHDYLIIKNVFEKIGIYFDVANIYGLI